MNYQTFTDTIRANFDNFNSKLSIPINIKNYDDINISKVENYYCNGNSLTFQPHIYNYKIAYWRVVKSIEIEISGQSDDYAQVIVNNSITVHPNLQDTLGIKDGIYIWGKTQSSDYVKEKHPFTMTNEILNIQFGAVNTLPTVCYLKASLKIRLFFQFTDTITSKATQLLSNSISTNLAIQNQETFTFKALDPGSNQVVGYSKSYIFTKKLRASFKYAKHIIVKFSGTANDYATINLNLGGNNYNYQSNASYYFAGCYSSVKPDGSFVDFVNYNLDQNINFNNNQVNVKITQHGTCFLWTDISVQGSILVQYKQFTDTLNPISIEISTLNKQLSNTVTYIFFNGEVKAQINYSSVIGCMRGVCLSEMNSSLSMWTTLSEFSVRVLSAGGNHSENIIVSSHTASYYGDYAVVYTKTGKIVKKGSYSVSCIVPAGNMGTPAYGQSGVFTIP